MPRLGIYPAQMLLVEKELQAIVLNYRRELFLLFHKLSVSMNLSWTTYNSFTIYPSFINSNLSINPLVTYTFLSSSTNTASASYFSKRGFAASIPRTKQAVERWHLGCIRQKGQLEFFLYRCSDSSRMAEPLNCF